MARDWVRFVILPWPVAARQQHAGAAGIGFFRKCDTHNLFSITCVGPSDRPVQRRRRGIFMAGDERSRSWAVSFCHAGLPAAWASGLPRPSTARWRHPGATGNWVCFVMQDRRPPGPPVCRPSAGAGIYSVGENPAGSGHVALTVARVGGISAGRCVEVASNVVFGRRKLLGTPLGTRTFTKVLPSVDPPFSSLPVEEPWR